MLDDVFDSIGELALDLMQRQQTQYNGVVQQIIDDLSLLLQIQYDECMTGHPLEVHQLIADIRNNPQDQLHALALHDIVQARWLNFCGKLRAPKHTKLLRNIVVLTVFALLPARRSKNTPTLKAG